MMDGKSGSGRLVVGDRFVIDVIFSALMHRYRPSELQLNLKRAQKFS